MQDHPADFPNLEGVCVVDGWGIRIYVRQGHLMVSDGIGGYRRERRFSKATVGFRRLVVLGHAGYLTFEAIRWLEGVRIPLIQISRSRVLAVSGSLGTDRADLRRAQALAAASHSGVKITLRLLAEKMAGQVEVAKRLPWAEIHPPVLPASGSIRRPADLRPLEAQLAAAYWKAWAGVPVQFKDRDPRRVPDHWRTFGRRQSPITQSGRLAANPANALLNYLYALLEAEARIAALAVGLDPGVGILHTDQGARDSMALDLMEPVRPQVDQYLLDLLQGRVFRAVEFAETNRGSCRLVAPLTHHLATTSTVWARALGPVAEEVAQMLLRPTAQRLPTPLTGSNRSAGRQEAARRRSTQIWNPNED